MAQLHRAQSSKHHLATQRQRGFTIVELLIVIVVIAILAAISIVAYNGIQERALNSARTSEARQWQNLLGLYYAEHGEYPISAPSSGEATACLGEGFPVIDGRQQCWDVFPGASSNSKAFVNDDLNQKLASFGNLPNSTRVPTRDGSGDGRLGPILRVTSDGVYRVDVILQTSDCPIGTRAWGAGNVSRCSLLLP